MRRLNGVEKGFLVLAALMIVCGGWMFLFPSEEIIGHGGYYTQRLRLPDWVEHRSRTETRVYGGLAGLMGAGFVGLVFYRRK